MMQEAQIGTETIETTVVNQMTESPVNIKPGTLTSLIDKNGNLLEQVRGYSRGLVAYALTKKGFGEELERVSCRHPELWWLIFKQLEPHVGVAEKRKAHMTRAQFSTNLDTLAFSAIAHHDNLQLQVLFQEILEGSVDSIKQKVFHDLLAFSLSTEVSHFYTQLLKFLEDEKLKNGILTPEERVAFLQGPLLSFMKDYETGLRIEHKNKLLIRYEPLKDDPERLDFLEEGFTRWFYHRIGYELKKDSEGKEEGVWQTLFSEGKSIQEWKSEITQLNQVGDREETDAMNSHIFWVEEADLLWGSTVPPERAGRVIEFDFWKQQLADRLKNTSKGRGVELSVKNAKGQTLAEAAIEAENWEALMILAKVSEARGETLKAVTADSIVYRSSKWLETLRELQRKFYSLATSGALSLTTVSALIGDLFFLSPQLDMTASLARFPDSTSKELSRLYSRTHGGTAVREFQALQTLFDYRDPTSFIHYAVKLLNARAILQLTKLGLLTLPKKSPSVAELLNEKGENGETLVYRCMKHSRIDWEAVAFLVQRGASLRVEADNESNAFDVSRQTSGKSVLNRLLFSTEAQEWAAKKKGSANQLTLFGLVVKQGADCYEEIPVSSSIIGAEENEGAPAISRHENLLLQVQDKKARQALWKSSA